MATPSDSDAAACVLQTPVTTHIQKRVQNSVTNLRSHKRRRISMASVDIDENLDVNEVAGSSAHVCSTADRFISNRPKVLMPLQITPRTRRISKQFGLVDDRVLNFGDDTDIFTSAHKDDATISLLRRSASSLFNSVPASRPTSVVENLCKRRNCLMVLDSPGVPFDPEAFPITWSRRNNIAVACRKDVYYQNLDTRVISHLCSTSLPGDIGVVQWGGSKHESHLALGITGGTVQMWDAGTGGPGTAVHTWQTTDKGAVKCLSWNNDILAVGMEGGEIHLTDVRAPQKPSVMGKHRSRVMGIEWSPSGEYLASGDKEGAVHIWDRRNGKSLLDGGQSQPCAKFRHKGSTKALAWCPWKPDLLASGSIAPEGKIKIWSTSLTSLSSPTHSPEPIHTIPLNTSVLSLHWSPHCKELLSTHGSSFAPLLSTSRHRTQSGAASSNAPQSSSRSQTKLTYTKTALTNSITVHEYPSCKRLMTLTNAHTHAVTHSCLSPNGESIFTVCPKEESIKMWQVWSERPPPPRRESAFDRCTIR
ncbi:WD repeat-containing protein slp1 [Psilocybe cubensis]|uniref:WD repeat-containing protein slp1 n=2 Tax=Psilocybe cubensis TaxID=181762 RepID=A0ACB8GN76_PSICU|nr:WD repeat-containing protein slp1 [Psilocybe cubensis]KAH9477126.1 WD repeat-containing protein slp1 [Psilocybe cubensis]